MRYEPAARCGEFDRALPAAAGPVDEDEPGFPLEHGQLLGNRGRGDAQCRPCADNAAVAVDSAQDHQTTRVDAHEVHLQPGAIRMQFP